MSNFRPMLAAKATMDQVEVLLTNRRIAGKPPMLASFKLDGVRATCLDGKVLSRSLKPIPNKHVQNLFGKYVYEGLDGELIVDQPYGELVCNRTVSGVMTEDGKPNVIFYVFDHVGSASAEHGFIQRNEIAASLVGQRRQIVMLPQFPVSSALDVIALEERALAGGFEGLILRDPLSPYKFGRSTLKQGWMIKLKRFMDSEAVIESWEPLERNANEQTLNPLGYMVRTSHKAGMVVDPSRMGRLVVHDLHKPEWKFSIGSGFSDDERLNLKLWRAGVVVKYKYMPYGVVDAPRHPIFLGLRDVRDLSSGGRKIR